MRFETLLAALDRPVAGSRVRSWSLCLSESRSVSLGIKDREAGNVHAPLSLSEAAHAPYLLVWDDGRISRGRFERQEIESTASDALLRAAAAAYDDPDAAQVAAPGTFPDVELYDETTARAAAGTMTELTRLLRAVAGVVARRRARTWSGSFGFGAGETRVLTSAGLDCASRGTSTSWHVTLNGELGTGWSGRRIEGPEGLERRMERAFDLSQALEVSAPAAAGGVRPVLLHPRVVEEYVLETLLAHLDGSTVYHREGRFVREQFGSGEPVLDERLTLRVDPLRAWGSGSYRCSAEGVPAQRATLVEGGRLVTPLLDLKHARRLDRSPTTLVYDADAIVLEGLPVVPWADALERAEGGALVLSVLGVHTQDRASGDFSLSAPQTLRIEEGALAGRWRITISGNLFELLRGPSLALVPFEDEILPGLLVPCRVDPK